MKYKRMDIYYEPLCEILSEEHAMSIPVCRDELKKREAKLSIWREQGYEFEKISCKRCSR